MLISIHIPKTAGTNFTQILKTIFKDRIHMDYGTEWDLKTARTCPDDILSDVSGFEARNDVVHGHFHFPKYQGVFAGASVLATLRHPVARIASQYRHIALHGNPQIEQHRRVMEGEMDATQLSKFPFIGNAQAEYLTGLDIDQLDHAIIQEHFPLTVGKFCTAIGVDSEQPDIANIVQKPINSRADKEWKTRAIPFDAEMARAIEQNCQRDLDLYNRAVERFVD